MYTNTHKLGIFAAHGRSLARRSFAEERGAIFANEGGRVRRPNSTKEGESIRVF